MGVLARKVITTPKGAGKMDYHKDYLTLYNLVTLHSDFEDVDVQENLRPGDKKSVTRSRKPTCGFLEQHYKTARPRPKKVRHDTEPRHEYDPFVDSFSVFLQ